MVKSRFFKLFKMYFKKDFCIGIVLPDGLPSQPIEQIVKPSHSVVREKVRQTVEYGYRNAVL